MTEQNLLSVSLNIKPVKKIINPHVSIKHGIFTYLHKIAVVCGVVVCKNDKM